MVGNGNGVFSRSPLTNARSVEYESATVALTRARPNEVLGFLLSAPLEPKLEGALKDPLALPLLPWACRHSTSDYRKLSMNGSEP